MRYSNKKQKKNNNLPKDNRSDYDNKIPFIIFYFAIITILGFYIFIVGQPASFYQGHKLNCNDTIVSKEQNWKLRFPYFIKDDLKIHNDDCVVIHPPQKKSNHSSFIKKILNLK